MYAKRRNREMDQQGDSAVVGLYCMVNDGDIEPVVGICVPGKVTRIWKEFLPFRLRCLIQVEPGFGLYILKKCEHEQV